MGLSDSRLACNVCGGSKAALDATVSPEARLSDGQRRGVILADAKLLTEARRNGKVAQRPQEDTQTSGANRGWRG